MGILVCTAPRIFVRRSAQQRPQGFSLTKLRNKGSSTENITYSRLLKEEERPTSTALKSSSPWLAWKRFSPHTVIKSYARAQEKRPYATQVCSAVTIWCCGDLLAQWIGDEDYNGLRTLRNIAIGCIVAIPSYKWCEIMDRLKTESVANTRAGSCISASLLTTHPNSSLWQPKLLLTK